MAAKFVGESTWRVLLSLGFLVGAPALLWLVFQFVYFIVVIVATVSASLLLRVAFGVPNRRDRRAEFPIHFHQKVAGDDEYRASLFGGVSHLRPVVRPNRIELALPAGLVYKTLRFRTRAVLRQYSRVAAN